jgi:MoxR-like ATPase
MARFQGEWLDEAFDSDENSKEAMVYRFAAQIEPGDIVIAKEGINQPKGVGVVASDYQFDLAFPPGDGADCHYRWVRWYVDLTESDTPIEVSDNKFRSSAEVRENSDIYHEIREILANRDSNFASWADSQLDQLESIAGPMATHCAAPDEITSEQAKESQLFENYGSEGGFTENLESTVAEPLSDSTRENLRKILKQQPVTDSDVLQALESPQLTAWAIGDTNNKEYAAIRPGDWLIHLVRGNPTSSVEYVQRVDVTLSHLPDETREELAEELAVEGRHSQLVLSTTPVVEPGLSKDEFYNKINKAVEAEGLPSYHFDITGFVQQINPKITHRWGGASKLLKEIFDEHDIDHQIDPQPTMPDSTLTPSGLTDSDDGIDSPAQSAIETINDTDSHFILLRDSGPYDDKIESQYHFTEGIPGSAQLPSAIEDGSVSFVGLNSQEDGDWVFDTVGRIVDFTTEDEGSGVDYYAETADVESIEPVPFRAVAPFLSKGQILRRGINEVRRADLKAILNWHHGPGVQAVNNLPEDNRTETYREALAHLIAGRNVVFYGPPGTGKTYTATELASAVCGPNSYDIETANAEWTNYDIVGGWAPGPDSDGHGPNSVADGDAGIDRNNWHAQEGIITTAAGQCVESLNDTQTPAWLIIDELNRANLDQAFGDVFTLLDLDYRAKTPLKYANRSQPLPFAFRLLATQNTYDQAQLFSLGYAFRRRFAFVEVGSELAGQGRHEFDIEISPQSTDVTEQLWRLSAPDLKRRIESMAKERLDYAEQSESTLQNRPDIDPAALFPQFSSTPRIEAALDTVRDRDMALMGEDFVETVLAVAIDATNRGVVDIGKAVLMDIVAYVLAYELAFPGDADAETVDAACCAYLVPQFETIMSELRQADALNQDSDTEDEFEEVIRLTKQLGLGRTGTRLLEALESNEIFN